LTNGQGSLGKLLHDETLVNTLQGTLTKLNTAAANAQSFAADLSSYTAKLQDKGSLANDLVTDTVVFARLRSSVVKLQEIAQSAEVIVQSAEVIVHNLDSASAGLNNTSSPVGVMLNDPKAAADLKATLHNLSLGSKKLDEDLEAVQHNFLLKGFFRKKAKQEAKMDTASKDGKIVDR
jgi:phospholipid/cholesterol/gamma-HCH transport system substrate-binding protein